MSRGGSGGSTTEINSTKRKRNSRSTNRRNKTQQLSRDKDNCHFSAHVKRKFNAFWSMVTLISVTYDSNIMYSLKSCAKTLTFIPKLSSISTNSSINIRNMRGPITLPWITPPRRSASSDRLRPTLVLWVLPSTICCSQGSNTPRILYRTKITWRIISYGKQRQRFY